MKEKSRKLYSKMLSKQAELNGVEHHGGDKLSFAVEPSVGQTLESKIQESADFLQRINIMPVDDIKGDKLGMSATGTIAGRTDTDSNDRKTNDPTGLDSSEYECAKTDFDTHIKYKTLDLWSKFKNFQTIWRDNVVQQIARDRMMIGFNGTSRAADTDRDANPLLEDVNIGWLEKIRQNASGARHLANYTLGESGNVKNIDALVLDAISSFLEPWHRTGTDLVVIAGRNIVADKYVALTDGNEAPTERAALATLMANKQLGNVPTMMVPFFPEDAFMVGRLDALSIYWQEESRRRTIMDNPKRDRIEDFQSVNEDYVVEDFGAFAFVEGITTAP